MSVLNLQKLLHTILLRSPSNLFDEFIIECQKIYNQPAHTFTELRTRENRKIKGDVFEMFCVLYLEYVKNYQKVWRLEDAPDEILQKLKLKRRDMGIDIIVEHNNEYFGVQCKYKKHTVGRKNCLSWRSLSTFYALCLRTGPWNKYIVMTNCDYAKHEGVKTEKDLSMCIGTFRGISKEEWVKMCEIEGDVLGNTIGKEVPKIEKILEPIQEIIPKVKPTKPINKDTPSLEELRLLRIAYYNKRTEI